jgi:ArsR family transcriptional regulator
VCSSLGDSSIGRALLIPGCTHIEKVAIAILDLETTFTRRSVTMARTELERLAALHKALSDQTRIRMMNVLFELGELCVCDLEAGLDITQSRASRHLGVLRQAGILAVRREGTWIYYRVHDDLSEATTAIVGGLRAAFGPTREARRDVARTRKLRRSC